MRMIDKGYTLMEVPGVELIEVEPDYGSDYGVHVMVKWATAGGFTQPWGLDELEELVAALSTARILGRRLAANVAANDEDDAT